MKNDDMWILWRLSTQEHHRFECSLILEYTDDSKATVINLNKSTLDKPQLDNLSRDLLGHKNSDAEHYQKWLHIQRQTPPFATLHETDLPIQADLSSLISCFIDVEALLIAQPKLAYIYLWAAAKHNNIYLETLYPLSQLRDIELREPNKVFVQMYPKIPSQKYIELEYEMSDSEGLPELLARIETETELISEAPVLIEKQGIDDHQDTQTRMQIPAHVPNDNNDTNQADQVTVDQITADSSDHVWGHFSSHDLADLIQGFNDWQRAHGRHALTDRLPPTLLNKLGSQFQIAFWTSGQGVSNMVIDDNPPRHTMVIGFIEQLGERGIGYCIQKPSSLDNLWTHQRWHTLECTEDKISKVTPLALY